MKIAFVLTAHVGALELVGQTVIDGNRAVDAFNDFTQTDFGRGAVEFISSCYAFVGLRDAGLGQLAQNFQCEPERYTGQLGNILCTLLSAGHGQTIGYADCVIRLVSNSQLVPSFLLEQL